MAASSDRGDADEATTRVGPDTGRPAAGRLIGRYRIIRELGRGGMGEVYLAGRADDEYRKHVALKLIRAGGEAREDLVRHFRRERQILAALDHPNIAKLLDGGTTSEGWPYFVMDYIQGLPIDEYCHRHRLSVAARLRLFESVCAAVAYAHRNLVIHRDIKPSNILVTSEGNPRLLDFGLARLLNPDLGKDTATAAGLGLTPAYASPEQVRGDPLNTTTDVYSLGVVLYELLTGQRPYRVKTSASVEILNAILQQDPERPSSAVRRTAAEAPGDEARPTSPTPERLDRGEGSVDRLSRRLRGDLDDVLLMALRKEPERRYRSVDAFAEDLRRYRERRPIMASRGTLAYRTSKFARRHAIGVAAALLTLTGIVGGGLAATYGFVRARAAEREAVAQAAKAEAINRFLEATLSSPDPRAQGRDVKVVDVLDRAASRAGDELAGQPAVEAAVRWTLGKNFFSLGEYEKARRQLELSLELQRQVVGSERAETLEVATDLASVLYAMGRYDEGVALQRRILAAQSASLGPDDRATLHSTLTLAAFLGQLGRAEESLGVLTDLIERSERRLGRSDDLTLTARGNRAFTLKTMGRLDEAEREYREVLSSRLASYGRDDPSTLNVMNNLAFLLDATGRYEGAAALHREAFEIKKRVLGETHPDTLTSWNGLALAYLHRGDAARAEELYREILEVGGRVLGPDNPKILRWQSHRARSLAELGRFEEAERLLLGAFRAARKQAGREGLLTQRTARDLVRFYEDWGKTDKAAEYARLVRGPDAR